MPNIILNYEKVKECFIGKWMRYYYTNEEKIKYTEYEISYSLTITKWKLKFKVALSFSLERESGVMESLEGRQKTVVTNN